MRFPKYIFFDENEFVFGMWFVMNCKKRRFWKLIEKEIKAIKENELLSKKDLYDELWRCRDLEINNLWQKSVFLGSFIVAVGTAYCAFIGKLLSGGIKLRGIIALWGDYYISIRSCMHLVAFAIAFVEIALSMLYLQM